MGFKSFILKEAEEKVSLLAVANRAVKIMSANTGKEIKYFGSGAAIVNGSKNMYLQFVVDKRITAVVILKNDSIASVSFYDGVILEPNGSPIVYVDTTGMKLLSFLQSCKKLVNGILSGQIGNEDVEYYTDMSEPEQTSESVLREAVAGQIKIGNKIFETQSTAIAYLLQTGMSPQEITKTLKVSPAMVSAVKSRIKSIDLRTVKVVPSKSAPSIKATNTPAENLQDRQPLKDDDIRLLYKSMGLYIDAVLDKKINGLVIAGNPGTGKSDMLEKKIAERGLKPLVLKNVQSRQTAGRGNGKTFNVGTGTLDFTGDYTLIKGKITVASFYAEICKNRHGLIVFDDCDSMFHNKDGENIMKALLDSKKKREVSYFSKNSVESTGDNDSEIMDILAQEKVPKRVFFDGQFIAITNLQMTDIDPAIIDRVRTVSLFLPGGEVFKRIKIAVETNPVGINKEIPLYVQKVIVRFFENAYADGTMKASGKDVSFRTFKNACEYYEVFGGDPEWEDTLKLEWRSGKFDSK